MPGKRAYRVAMRFLITQQRHVGSGDVIDENAVGLTDGEASAVGRHGDGKQRFIRRRQRRYGHSSRCGRARQNRFIPVGARSDPTSQHIDLIGGKLLFGRHVRIGIRRQDFDD
jgi:hypothetical protein